METGKILKKVKISIIGIVILTIVSRFIPHPPNFTPVGGLALFSGSKIYSRFGFFIPLSAMFISDIFLGFHSIMIYVYLSFMIIFFIGRLIKKVGAGQILLASCASSLLFFLITNFGVWLSTNMYLKNLNGLISCYVNGLPFFRNTFIGDLVYSFGFFYGYRFVFNFFKKTHFTAVSDRPLL